MEHHPRRFLAAAVGLVVVGCVLALALARGRDAPEPIEAPVDSRRTIHAAEGVELQTPEEDDEPIVTPLPAGVKFHEPPEGGGDDDDGAKDDDDLPAYTEVVDGASLANVERSGARAAAAAARE